MARPRKVVFLGFCSGDKSVIKTLIEAGKMPTFRALLENGLVGHTMGLPGFFVGTTWPSFMTAVSPARHRVYSWEQLKPGSYETYRCKASDHLQCEPFWNALSRAGRRVAVMDVPHSGASQDLNGIQLVEWGAHDANHGFHTWPPALADEVVTRFGQHPVRGLSDATRSPEEFVVFRDNLLEGVETKAVITRHFMRQDDWEFFAQVFTEGHCAGHLCWHLHDPRHPRYDPEVVAFTGDPLVDVYAAIDNAIGEVLAEVDRETTVIVLASHGMGPKFGAQHLCDQILLRLGVAAPYSASAPAPDVTRLRDRIDPLLTWGWQHMPGAVQDVLQPVRNNLRHWVKGDPAPRRPSIDPAGGQCFLVQNNAAHAGIRVNLDGREPNGVVKPGAEYDRFLDQLTQDFEGIVNLETGKRIVGRVIKTRDHYRGDQLEHLPDLLVEWSNAAPTRIVGSDKLGVVEGEDRYCRTGDHTPGGMFAAFGPGLQKGRLGRAVSIMDIAPTITAMLGVNLPDVDGRPIPALL